MSPISKKEKGPHTSGPKGGEDDNDSDEIPDKKKKKPKVLTEHEKRV